MKCKGLFSGRGLLHFPTKNSNLITGAVVKPQY